MIDEKTAPTLLIGVPYTGIEAAWPYVQNLIEKACARSSGRYTAQDVKEGCLSRDMQLWTAWRGTIVACAVTEILIYPKIKTCRVMIVTGIGRRQWQQFNNDIARWAKGMGCSMIEAGARPGWARVLKGDGYRSTHVMLERDL